MARRLVLRPGQLAAAALLALLSLTTAEAQVGQSVGSTAPSATILTLDQDRLFAESLFGRRLLNELERQSAELAALNKRVTAELTAEEKALTEKRRTLAADEFRLLANAFDEKVTRLREDQDGRIRLLQRRRDSERRAFTARVLPMLADIVRESGAMAILDSRAVILSVGQIDITDRAIARIDRILGDGGELGAPADPDADTGETETPPEDASDLQSDPPAD